MFASRGFFGAGVVKPNLTDRDVDDVNTGTDEADAFVVFQTNGELWIKTTFAYLAVDGEWMTGVITPAEAAGYELIANKTAGTLTYGATGTFNLGTARKFGCYIGQNLGSQTASVTFQIRKVGTTEILASCSIPFEAYSSNA